MPPLTAGIYAAAIFVSVLAAFTDGLTGRIPNWLTLPTLLLAIAMHAAFGGLLGVMASLLGVMATGSVPIVFYRISHGKAIGGGDIKLFAALGALLGAELGVEVEFGAFVLLSFYALIRVAARGQLVYVVCNAVGLLVNPILPRQCRRVVHPANMTEMRMGPAIATSVLSSIILEQLGHLTPWLR